MVKRKLMNTRTNKQLLLGHATLHRWARNNFFNKPSNWTRRQIATEHNKIVKIMLKRGFRHNSPLRA